MGLNPGRGEFSAPFQTGHWAHPASYTVGTGSFLWEGGQGVALTTHPHSVLKLQTE
jgi:hypothetical protein